MQNIINSWTNYMNNKSKSQLTISAYNDSIQELFSWIEKNKNIKMNKITDMKKIKLTDLDDYISYLKNKGNSESTIAKKINAIRNFYRYIISRNIIKVENIAMSLEIPKVPVREKEFLKMEDVKNLLSSVEGENQIRDRAIIALFINAGLRLSELQNANINSIKEDKITVIGKGNKQRTITLGLDTISLLNKWLEIRPTYCGDALFMSKRGQRIARNSIQHMIKENLKRIGKENATTHSLRHTSASLLVKAGVDLKQVQERLGHTSLQVTTRYLHTDDEQKQAAANAINFDF